MNICHLFERFCNIIVIVYETHFKDHLEILGIDISVSALTLVKFCFCKHFLEKLKHDQYYSCAHLFGTSITLLQLLISP